MKEKHHKKESKKKKKAQLTTTLYGDNPTIQGNNVQYDD